MPEKETLERAEKDREEGKAPSTQAGEFIREEMDHIREGKHGARSPQQAIAIGLSKARRAGVDLPPPREGKASPEVRERAERDIRKGRSESAEAPSPRRSRSVSNALKREGGSAASSASLSRHERVVAAARGKESRQRAAKKAVRTKGPGAMSQSARKAARTRSRNK